MEIKRILIPDENYDGAAINTALQLLGGLIAQDDDIRECVLLIPVKANIQGTTLSAVLGDNVSKALHKGQSLKLGTGNLRLETSRSFSRLTKGHAILVVYANQKMMDVVDSNNNFKHVISVPESYEDVKEWARTWSPIVPGEEPNETRIIDNKVIEAALKSITSSINLSNRILNPRDKEAVNDAFRILKANSQYEDPVNIRAWCIKNGWDSKGADEAMKLANKAFSLKSKPSKYGHHWADNVYQKWLKESK